MGIMIAIDPARTVYLFVHGRQDLEKPAIEALVSKGFSKEKIIQAKPNVVGQIGDYMAMLWMPPNPDRIKIQKITKVEQVAPEGMVGLWKGVSKEDLFSVPIKR